MPKEQTKCLPLSVIGYTIVVFFPHMLNIIARLRVETNQLKMWDTDISEK